MRYYTKKPLAVIDIRTLFQELKLPYKEHNYGDLWFPCRRHGEKINTSHPDAHINARVGSQHYGKWKCFGCGEKGNYISIIKDALKCDWNLAKAIAKKHELSPGEFPKVEPRSKEKHNVLMPTFYEAPKNRNEWPSEYLKYLEGREVTWSQIKRFEIGYVEAGDLHGRVVAPVYLGKEFRNYVARAITKNLSLKVLTAKGGNVGLFGSQYAYPRMPAILFEGWLDALAVDRLGYLNAYALGTNRIHDVQMQFLSKFPYLIVVSDNDNGGKIMVDSFGSYQDEYDIRVADVRKFFGKFNDASELLSKHEEDRLEQSILHASEWKPCREEFEVEVIL